MGRALAGPQAPAIPELASDSLCGHCGLAAPSGAAYCCYGCELAASIAAEAARDQHRKKGVLTLALLLSMSVMMLSLFLYAEDVYGLDADPAMARLRELWRFASAVLATPVIALCGLPLGAHAVRALRQGRLGTELLVVTGAVAAYGLSLRSLLRGEGGVYFDSASSALLLTTFGRYLEASARARAAGLLGPSLESASVSVLAARGEEALAPVPASRLAAGMRLQVPVDGVLPVDARLLAPVEVNLGVLTGESAPRALAAGDRVPAGAVPISGPLEAEALASTRESTLERLAELARGLAGRRAPLQRLSDRLAQALTPAVWILCVLSFAWWVRHASVERAVGVSLAVALAACPCTFGIATPLVLWLSLRRALGAGVLIRDAGALESLARVRRVAFDKTGTLTDGTARVSAVELSAAPQASTGPLSEAQALSLASALEEGSRHPIARAIVQAAQAAGTGEAGPADRAQLSARHFDAGGGVRARDRLGRELHLGSPQYLTRQGVRLEAQDHADRVLLAIDHRVVARFRIGEQPRPEAAQALAELTRAGVAIRILTGDASDRAERLAAELGLSPAVVEAGLGPSDKAERLLALGNETAMVGDGINDAPGLAGVGPGFAVAGGSSLARGMASVVLLSSDLRLVPFTLALAARAVRLARRNLGISIAYNALFLGLALTGSLRPVWAGLSMLGSSLLVLASSLEVARGADPSAASLGAERSQPA